MCEGIQRLVEVRGFCLVYLTQFIALGEKVHFVINMIDENRKKCLINETDLFYLDGGGGGA